MPGVRLSAGSTESSAERRLIYNGELAVSSPYSANSGIQNWNTYVQRASQSILCTGGESGADICIHAGERRRLSTHFNSCDDLELSDSLSAFDCSCVLGGQIT